MEWQFILALVLAIPVILFSAAYVWYLNIGGLRVAVWEAWKKRAMLAEERPAKK
jgi:hypothetical protein